MLELNAEQLGIAAVLIPSAMMVLGLMLWLLGRSLAKPACVVSGLVLGGAGGWVLGQLWADQGAISLALVIGGGLGGALLCALMFRLWMAFSGALLLGLLGPAMMFAWQGTSVNLLTLPVRSEQASPEAQPDAASVDTQTLTHDVIQQLRTLVETPSQEASSPTSSRSTAESGVLGAQVRDAAREAYHTQVDELWAWWEGLDMSLRMLAMGFAAVGAGIGLILGLVLPYVAASFESALAGAVLMLLAGGSLIEQHWVGGAVYLPRSPQSWLIAVGLITAGGIVIQWTLFARKADK